MGIDILNRAIEQSSRVKKGIDTIPDFTPKNFYEQIQLKSGAVYVYINNEWIKVTTPTYTGILSIPASAGDVSYTGIGFKPKIIKTNILGETTNMGVIGHGYTKGVGEEAAVSLYLVDTNNVDNSGEQECAIAAMEGRSTSSPYPPLVVRARLKSFDDDGFTLTWTDKYDGSGSIDIVGNVIYTITG